MASNIIVIFLYVSIFQISLFNIAFGQGYVNNAHSHNDYLNKEPLAAALKNNFKSIEVDIFLSKTKLYVGHNRLQLKKGRTIETLYLDPLWELFLSNDGHIYENNISLYLLVDIKTSGIETYSTLQKVLDNYEPMLSYVDADSLISRAVTIIISGNKPGIIDLKTIKKRNVFIDGRFSDIGQHISNNLIPLISSNWKENFKWDGVGVFPENELILLKSFIQKVHSENKEIRFWGSPDNKISWEIMTSAGVDLINTDKVYDYIDFKK